jgi:hypothetical protein
VSDNTKVTSFYALKAQPTLQSPLLYFGQAAAAGGQQATTSTVPESSAVRELFTNNVATKLALGLSDEKPRPGPQKVSNLVRDPALNVKYDDAWFLKQNPQHWTNLRTMGLLKDLSKEEEDPIMKLNPTLYQVV